MLSVSLLRWLMEHVSGEYWRESVRCCCVLQRIYALFVRQVQPLNDNGLIRYDTTRQCVRLHATLELMYAFAMCGEAACVNELARSDFNTHTCLLAARLFDLAASLHRGGARGGGRGVLSTANCPLTWSHTLRLYVNIQTCLLAQLKYKYVKDAIVFFGSYYDQMIHVSLSSLNSIRIDRSKIIFLFIIFRFCRYSEVCNRP